MARIPDETMGAWSTGGTVIDWVMRAEGVSFRHAVELLSAGKWDASGTAAKISAVRKLAPPIERDAHDAKLLLQVVEFYHETLKQSPDALAYLPKRGLTHPEMIDKFKLGFANRTLGYRLPQSNRIAGADIRGRLQKLGIYCESGQEHFNGSIVIPSLAPLEKCYRCTGAVRVDAWEYNTARPHSNLGYQTPEAFRESFAPSPRTVEVPQILAAVKAKPYRAPAAALTAAPVCWPDAESGAKEKTIELNLDSNVV